MTVIWYLCQNTYGLEIIWSFLPFHKPYFIQNYSFGLIFIAIRGESDRYGWHMVIYERSASMKVIWYACVNIHGLEIIWSFLAFHKPYFVQNYSFRVIFIAIRGQSHRYGWHMVIYERSASMKVIWYSCVNIHGLEIIWTFIAFEKPSLMTKTSFCVIFYAILRGNDEYCWHMVIYERSASIKVIWYSSVNIYALEILWTFIVFEKPSLMRKMTFHVLFLVKIFLGKNFFQQKFFCSECFNSQKNHVFEISIFHQNLDT